MRIQELERLVGADRATIRYYEKEGLIVPQRSENGYRDYTEENAQELKRILLLRQLGVSIYTISRLQKGSADFREVLEEQIRTLTRQIGENKRAKAVCQTMRDDDVAYSGLDAAHYLELMKTISIDDDPTPRRDFQEDLPKEIHPWRRYFARWLDYNILGTVMLFLIIVVLRIRPVPGNFLNIVLAVLYGFLFVPIEAFMLSKWGTTPGKYAMGIRLESINGGNLSFQQARERAWTVLRDGMCFYIPILEFISLLHRYAMLTGRSLRRFARREDIAEPEEMPWDEETEIVYQPLTRRRGVALAALIAFFVVLNVFSGVDSIKPKHRGNTLTVAQFAENYNQCLSIISPNAEQYDKLQADGTKYPVPQGTYIFDVDTGGAYVPDEFVFETDGDILKSVSLQKHWVDGRYLAPMNDESVCLALTALLSQKGAGFQDLKNLAEQIDAAMDAPSGTISYKDLFTIEWSIEAENYICSDGVYFIKDDSATATLDYRFIIIFH